MSERGERATAELRGKILVVLREQGPMSGYPLSRALRVRSARIYRALHGLLDEGRVSAEFIDAGDGKPARRHYWATP